MSTVKERFNELLEKKEETKTQLVQLETKRESAVESMDNIMKTWKENWNITSYEQAKEKLASLEKEIEETMTKCEEYLTKVGV